MQNPNNTYSGGTNLGTTGTNGQLQVNTSSVIDSSGTFVSGPLGIAANSILQPTGVNVTQGPVIIGNNAALGTGLVTLPGGTLQDDGRAAYTIANPVLVAAAPFSPTAPVAVGGTATFFNLTVTPAA